MIARTDNLAGDRAPDDARGGMDFLGPEFLTWLWWRSEAQPAFVHPDGEEIYIHVDDYLEFRGERSAARRTALRSGMPGASREARAALRTGKVLFAARLLLVRGEDEIRFTLRAEDLDVASLRLPAPEGDSPHERASHSLEMQGRFLEDLDLCLHTFLRVRCSDQWLAELERIQVWGVAPSPDERVFMEG